MTGAGSRSRIRRALGKLEGERLASVRVDARTGATDLSFDLGGALEIRRFNVSDEDDLWILYCPDERCLAVRPDGRMSFEVGSSADIWVPI